MKFYFLIIVVISGLIVAESKLLRSKHLTQDMIDNIEELDKYEKKARRIFNKYEKAKFYQIVAYTYYDSYNSLVSELESLDRHYYYIFSNYDAEELFSSIDMQVTSPGVQNEFTPILFEENSTINIKLFKAKASMFKKQYHDYLNYFNQKVGIYNNKFKEIKRINFGQIESSNHNKIYNDYKSFLLDIESIDRKIEDELNVIFDGKQILEIIWPYSNHYKRKFYYFEDSMQLIKTIDFRNQKKILETDYNINYAEDDFLSFIKSNNILHTPLEEYGTYSVQEYNNFEKVSKKTYYLINNKIIGVIVRDFEEDFLKLISEKWYIGNYNRKVREFNSIFDPKSDKYIWIEEKYK